jgi:hypothetical protein
MASCDWFKMMWTSKNMMWKFSFGTYVLKLTFTYNSIITLFESLGNVMVNLLNP